MKTLLFAACLLLAGVAQADDALFKDIESKLVDAPVIRGQFTQSRQLQGVKKPLTSTGSFLVDKQRGVIWKAEKPFPSTLRVTRGEILQKNGDQVMMKLSADKEPTVKTVSGLLFSLFSGDVGSLGKVFNAQGNVSGKNWKLALTPKDAALAKLIAGIQLQGAGTVEHIQLNAASGDVTQIDMHDVTTGQSLTATENAFFE
ncbi:outer membrane lipoprotein carrier protein LolA [Silvimonas iriomotensis]|uniref:Outer-membrane lipoprotein carrier protein n=1 Tax=Silvimonas iriomotensis TaxID=449662 RepID=A0ABQ2PAD5_9NEIS|nr:outer membrane lipoprotein carrier protein LolA [Silvimonas iriomotensis]GGP21742.1 outer-membrane lipoprotein carrier protein [Silvimonas iriomotensis]